MVDSAVFTPPGGLPVPPEDTLHYSGMAVGALKDPATGNVNFFPVGAKFEDNPQMFYGFLVASGGSGIILATGRGSLVQPRVVGGAALVPGGDVYLSLVPGYVTQNYQGEDGSAYLRVGYALDAICIILAPDVRVGF